MTLALRDVTLHPARAARPICQHLEMQIEPGQCWGILGLNGAGKTTVLRAMAGLHAPTSGQVMLDGIPLTVWHRRDRAGALGVLLSGPGIDFPLTVQECVLHGRYATAPSWRGFGADDKKMADMALAEVELTALATRDVRTLSSGERHRVAMARLLAQDPWLLLIDEAVEHLDLYYRMRLLERLREHSRRPGRAGRFGAVGLVLHDINLAARYCDHLLCLFPDGQTWHGATPSFLQTDRLRQLFRYPLVAMEGPTGTAWLPV